MVRPLGSNMVAFISILALTKVIQQKRSGCYFHNVWPLENFQWLNFPGTGKKHFSGDFHALINFIKGLRTDLNIYIKTFKSMAF